MRLLISLLLLACPFSAMAVYKCESGRSVSYSDMPCTGGKSSTIDTAHNSVGPEAAAENPGLESQKTTLQQLERTRHRREAREEKQAQKIARVRAARQKKCAGLAQRQKWREEDAAQAVGKTAERTRLKARRMAEAYRLECA